MTAQKPTDAGQPKSATAPSDQSRRKWTKKSPTEIVAEQVNKLRTDVARREQELQLAKQQLEKLERAAEFLGSM